MTTRYRRRAAVWYGQFADAAGKRVRVKLCADKSAARLKLAELVRQVGREKLGLSDPAEEHARRPLTDHLTDYETHLRQRGNCSVHVRGAVAQVRAVAVGRRWAHLKDVDATAAGSGGTS